LISGNTGIVHWSRLPIPLLHHNWRE